MPRRQPGPARDQPCAEKIAKTLARLSIGFFEQQPLALNECRNKWVIWNLLTDLRDFVS